MVTNTLIATSGTDLLTASGNLAVVTIGLCNISAVDVDVDMYVIPNGQIVEDRSKVISGRTLRQGDSVFIDTLRILLSNGDKIRLTATVDQVVSALASYTSI